jgi:phage-related protein
MEIVAPHKKETYRAVYALKIGTRIYVLHSFQKKAKHGIKTPKPDLELIDSRYKAAKRMEEEHVQ